MDESDDLVVDKCDCNYDTDVANINLSNMNKFDASKSNKTLVSCVFNTYGKTLLTYLPFIYD